MNLLILLNGCGGILKMKIEEVHDILKQQLDNNSLL